ncbi:MAG: hypothetical protein IT381_01995 [Deltaproteobacteria bacterium]|nr:hypothetical protein [Deltaproteobacteria bacterium]
MRATNGDDAAKISATPASPLEGWVIGSVPGDVAAIAYGGGVFVASSAGKPTTKVLRSTDGTTWTDSAFPGSGLGRVVFTQGKFYIAAFTGGIYSSADGVSWATEFTPATMGRQIAAAEDGTIVVLPNVVRANGAWSNSASNLPATVGQDVAFGAGRFVAVSGSGAIYSSTNAITWQEETDHPAVDSVHSLRFTGDRFVALGSGGAGMGARLLSSSDGRHWTMVTPDEGACPFADVAFAQGIFVTVGAQQRICTSSDLSVWRLRETIPALPFPEPAGTPALSAVIYANGKWVAVGENTGVTHP